MDSTGIVPTMPITGNTGFGSDSGLWLFALLILFGMGGFGGFGNRNGVPTDYATTQDVTYTSAFNELQSENNSIIGAIGNARQDVITAVKDAAYNNLTESRDIEATVNAGFANMQTCCCNLDKSILENRYLSAQNTASINANTTAGIQKVIDKLNEDKISALQGRINALELANATSNIVRYPTMTTYCSGANPFCCGCSGSLV